MERKTNIVTTPSGIEVGIKEFITAGEFLDLQDSADGNELSQKEIAKRLMAAAVVSVSGNTENIPERLREIPIPDYLFLTKEVAKLVSADFTKAETQA